MQGNIKLGQRLFSLVLIAVLIFQQTGFSQGIGQLEFSKYLSQTNVLSAQDKFTPVHLRSFSYHPNTDKFLLFLDKGDSGRGLIHQTRETGMINQEAKKLLQYFLTGVSLQDEKFWVNLRPDSEDQIIDPVLARTDFGKILLEADLQLKKDVAMFTSPQTPEGKEYWDKLYKRAGELFGTENVDIPTLTRPWIVPGEVIIRETADSTYIYKASLKVMLEEDYRRGGSLCPPDNTGTAQRQDNGQTQGSAPTGSVTDPRLKQLNTYSTQLIREKIIPKLTKEVNSSAKYSALRQVFYSLVLSRWFKAKFSGKNGVYSRLINTGKLDGLTSQQLWSKTDYFNAYKGSFSKGEYNIKQQINTLTGPVIRTYFSGGADLGNTLVVPAKKVSSGVISDIGTFNGNNPSISNTLGNGLVVYNVSPGRELTLTTNSSLTVKQNPLTPTLSPKVRGKTVSSAISFEPSKSVIELRNNIMNVLKITDTTVQVRDEFRFQQETVYYLAREASLNENPDVRQTAQRLLREAGISLGIKEASIHNLYAARWENKWGKITVPAYNIRTGTLDVMKEIFKSAITNDIMLLIFELAGSEMRYSAQDQAEYVAMVYAAAIATGYRGYMFIQADHYQVNAADFKKDRTKTMNKLFSMIEKAVNAGMLNIDIDPSTLVRPEVLDLVLDFERKMVNRYIEQRRGGDPEFAKVIAKFGGIKGFAGLSAGRDTTDNEYFMYKQLRLETPEMRSLRRKLVDDLEAVMLYIYGDVSDLKKYYDNLNALKTEDPDNSLEIYGIKPDNYRSSLEEFIMTILSKTDCEEIQRLYREMHSDTVEVTVDSIKFIRNLEQSLKIDVPISIGVEERHIDNKQHQDFPSTIMGSITIMGLIRLNLPEGMVGPSKEALQTGTMHGLGGTPELGIHRRHTLAAPAIGVNTYVQHGTSNVEDEYFPRFPEADAGEAHLATKYQAVLYGKLPRQLIHKMTAFLEALLYPEKSINDPEIEGKLKAVGLLDTEKRQGYAKKFLRKWEKALAQTEKTREDIFLEIIGDFLPPGIDSLKDLTKELSAPFKQEISLLPEQQKSQYLVPLFEEFQRIHEAFNVKNTRKLVRDIMGPVEQFTVQLPPRPEAMQQAVMASDIVEPAGVQYTIGDSEIIKVNPNKVKVAINGFGRIGKLVLKAFLEKKYDFEIVAVNDLDKIENLAHLFRHDSTFGAFKGQVGVDKEKNDLIINGQRIHVYKEKEPANLPWKDLGVEIVIEATGRFTKREDAKKHLDAGAKRVVITAPGKNEDLTVVLGVNQEIYNPEKHQIISNASCTTNGLAPVVKVINEAFGIKIGSMLTVHAATNDQRILDAVHDEDQRRARATLGNIIPTTTGAAKAIGKVIPELQGRLDGLAMRVPTVDVSAIYLAVEVKKDTTFDEVNAVLKKAATEGPLSEYIDYTEENLVSSDFLGNPKSSIVDASLTKVTDKRVVNLIIWYDNEWGYSNRTIDLVNYIISRETVNTAIPNKDDASSSLTVTNNKEMPLGGIDFRVIQPMGNLSGINLSLPKLSNAANINLDNELKTIQRMVSSGIMPNENRLENYVAACYQTGKLKQYLEGIVTCLTDMYKLDEKEAEVTSKGVKKIMLVLESAR